MRLQRRLLGSAVFVSLLTTACDSDTTQPREIPAASADDVPIGATVLDFEDLNFGADYHPMQNYQPYHGLTFSSLIYGWNFVSYGRPHSGTNFLFSAQGENNLEITFAEPVLSFGAWIGNPHGVLPTFWLEGYSGATKVGESPHIVLSQEEQYLAVELSQPADKIRFVRPQFQFATWSADDICFSTQAGPCRDLLSHQTIAFSQLADKQLGDPAFQVTATASSGLPVTFVLGAGSTGCSLDPVTRKVSLTGVTASGSYCTIVASQSGDQTYHPATSIPQSFRVTYNFSGFFQPVDNNGVFNKAKAGSGIPLKFGLAGNQGLSILQMDPTSTQVNCPGQMTVDALEEYTTSTSGLHYDVATNQYTYVWKTGSWAGTCRQIIVRLNDGSGYTALFQFTK